jgi:hypothetical protein
MPVDWAHSSYLGYARRTSRNEFVQYDTLYEAWRGENGGNDPASAYRRYVIEGLSGTNENPLKSALREWVIGSEDFLNRMVAMAEKQDEGGRGGLRRRLGAITVDKVMAAVAEIHEVDPAEYVGFRSLAAGREMAALVCRRYTSATLAELSERFGLRHPDSSANLVRRAKQREDKSIAYRQRIADVEARLRAKTENQV